MTRLPSSARAGNLACRRSLIPATVLFALAGSPIWAQAPRLASPTLDEKVLRDQQLPTNAAGLIDFFRKRTPDPALMRTFDDVLGRCGSDTYADRARAADELARMGVAIRPLLQRVLNSPPADRELVQRVHTTLLALPHDLDAAAAMAAARLLAAHTPAAALDSLLHYLPFAADTLVLEEVQATINTLAAAGAGKPAAVLVAALKDRDPIQRASAGEALSRSGAAGKALAEPLLRDAQPRVRLQVALARADAGERDAVPVLIELLAVLPPAQAWTAQDTLLRLVDDDTTLPMLGGPLTPAQVTAAWSAWWKQRPAGTDVTALSSKGAMQGHTLVACAGTGIKNARVVELGPDHQPRWQIDGLRYPVDVQFVGKNRVLIAEYLGRRVTERDHKGTVLWDLPVQLPIACQRLPGGLTFIAARQQLMVVDRQGHDTLGYRHVGPSILAAQRLHDGHMVIVCSGGTCHVLDPQGRELKNFRVGQLYTMGSNIDVLPAGRVLVPLYTENIVAEFDFEGNQLWKASVSRPTSAVRLPSGNTLVTSYLENRVVEITPEGSEVWSYATDSRPWRARKR